MPLIREWVLVAFFLFWWGVATPLASGSQWPLNKVVASKHKNVKNNRSKVIMSAA